MVSLNPYNSTLAFMTEEYYGVSPLVNIDYISQNDMVSLW